MTLQQSLGVGRVYLRLLDGHDDVCDCAHLVQQVGLVVGHVADEHGGGLGQERVVVHYGGTQVLGEGRGGAAGDVAEEVGQGQVVLFEVVAVGQDGGEGREIGSNLGLPGLDINGRINGRGGCCRRRS